MASTPTSQLKLRFTAATTDIFIPVFVHSFTHLSVVNAGNKIINNTKLLLPNGGE